MIDERSVLDLSFQLAYQDGMVQGKDTLHVECFDMQRDGVLLPAPIRDAILAADPHTTVRLDPSAGKIVVHADPDLVRPVDIECFHDIGPSLSLQPRYGRFYPATLFSRRYSDYRGSRKPARMVYVAQDALLADFNHPLADRAPSMQVKINDAHPAASQPDNRYSDHLHDLLTGPGMQLRARIDGDQSVATDFFEHGYNRRIDENTDTAFYTTARIVSHIDSRASRVLQDLHGEIIPRGAAVLDLMSSITSHLAENLETTRVTGLGMNADEMARNPRLDSSVVHDLNLNPVLPFDDGAFDVVLCNLSAEYLTAPFEVFDEVARVLVDDGIFIVSFSNRWFPTKAIDIWANLHDFERMGLVLEYFARTGRFGKLHSSSTRGLRRPANDSYELPFSDPVYVVWGHKI